MALNFDNTFPEPDFLPSADELETYRTLSHKHDMYENLSPRKRPSRRVDEYDDYGRNITEYNHRQNKVPWVKVKYVKGRMYIPNDKKNILRSMGLF
jgi:hypothetical protein|tara:strand:+ start:104 stop:391 length:288 start_codon:yes stop_codon:yes gene_type:complete